MKISKIETIRSPDRAYCWILLYTDSGHVGLGETYHRADPAEQVVHEFARQILLGSNPENVERLWDRMYKLASFHGLMGAELRAMSGIDTALWDLQGNGPSIDYWVAAQTPVFLSISVVSTMRWPGKNRRFRTGRNSVLTRVGRLAKQLDFLATSTVILPVISAWLTWRQVPVDSSGSGRRLAITWKSAWIYTAPSMCPVPSASVRPCGSLPPISWKNPFNHITLPPCVKSAIVQVSLLPLASASSRAGGSAKFWNSRPPMSSTPIWLGLAVSPRYERSLLMPRYTTSPSHRITTDRSVV